jgi:hypothetical protein
MIKKENGKWNLYTKDGKRLLSTHATAEEAIDQQAANKANQPLPTLTRPDKDGNRIDFAKKLHNTYSL